MNRPAQHTFQHTHGDSRDRSWGFLRVIQRMLSAACQASELEMARIEKVGAMSDEKDAPDDIDEDETAVALTYKPGQDQAPRVVAKGQGWLARQIIEVAEAHGIEIREDANLARILAEVDVDSEIPLEAFTVVAEILSYVYEKNKQWPEGVGPQSKPRDQRAHNKNSAGGR